MKNSLDALDSGGTITVTARAHADSVSLQVEDDGPGIPEKLAQQVIQRGVRADEGIKGHGIGLSVVKIL